MALNGRLSAADLATIPGTSRRIRADLVPQTAAMRAAFEVAMGKPLVVTDGYRPYSGDYYAQVETFLRRYTRAPLLGRPTKVWNGVRYWQRPGTSMAAVPGTSNHGWGTAIDFGSGVNAPGREHDWLRANGPRFGWSWPEWWARAAGEWWHFEAVPVPVSNYRNTPTAPTAPDLTLPDPLEEDDMSYTPDQIAEFAKDGVGRALGELALASEPGAAPTKWGRQTLVHLGKVARRVVWGHGDTGTSVVVARGTEQTSALQELADIKTLLMQINQRLSDTP